MCSRVVGFWLLILRINGGPDNIGGHRWQKLVGPWTTTFGGGNTRVQICCNYVESRPQPLLFRGGISYPRRDIHFLERPEILVNVSPLVRRQSLVKSTQRILNLIEQIRVRRMPLIEETSDEFRNCLPQFRVTLEVFRTLR